MTSLSTDRSETLSSMTPPSPTNMNAPSSSTGAVIGAIIGVLCVIVVVVLAVYFWYFKRRKQSHSFHDTPAGVDHATPSFRVLSTWEEAMTNQQKHTKDDSEYTPSHMSYSTPDLIAGTNDSDVIQNNQYGRLRNDTITSETSNLPTIVEVSERPLSGLSGGPGFDNPGFDIGLDDILDTSRFKLGHESSREEESDNERNSSKSPTDLEKDVSIMTADPTNERTIEHHSEEDDQVSTIDSRLSDELKVEIDDVSQRMEVVHDTNSEDIENGVVNADFVMETDMDGNGTSSESPTPSSDIDNSS